MNVLPYSWVTPSPRRASKPSEPRDEVRQADRHLGEAAQRSESGRRGPGAAAGGPPWRRPRTKSGRGSRPGRARPLPAAPQVEVARRRAPARPGCTRAGRSRPRRALRARAPGGSHANTVMCSADPARRRDTRDGIMTSARVGFDEGTIACAVPAVRRRRGSRLSAASRAATAPEILPLRPGPPGMKGVGRTVFEGTRSRSSRSRSSASWRTSGPKQSMILARLAGGPLAKTGVIAGMSGSPVLHRRQAGGRRRLRLPVLQGDDRRHHAHRRDDRGHAHRRPPRGRPARACGSPWHAAGGLPAPLDQAALVAGAAAARRGERARRAPSAARCRPRRAAASADAARAAPGLLGLRPADVRVGARDLRRAGLHARDGRRRRLRGAARAACPTWQPGGAVGISLIEGDMDLSATGTITHIDQGPRLRVRPSLLQPGADAVPDAEGVRVLGLPEPLPVLEDQRARRGARRHHGPGPHHRHRRAAWAARRA